MALTHTFCDSVAIEQNVLLEDPLMKDDFDVLCSLSRDVRAGQQIAQFLRYEDHSKAGADPRDAQRDVDLAEVASSDLLSLRSLS